MGPTELRYIVLMSCSASIDIHYTQDVIAQDFSS